MNTGKSILCFTFFPEASQVVICHNHPFASSSILLTALQCNTSLCGFMTTELVYLYEESARTLSLAFGLGFGPGGRG